MSSKHRHGLPRKRPPSSKQEAIDAELPVLESVDGTPTLEPADDGPITITCEAASEAGIDTVLTINVPQMEKSAVAKALEKPLLRAVAKNKAELRFRSALVRFTGEALIGSAIKDLVKDALAVAKPVQVMVRRGFGDEIVHKGEAPKLDVAQKSAGGITTVTVDTGDLEGDDVAGLFAPVLKDLAKKANGQKYAFEWNGAAKPDAALRDQIETTLRDAGAVRAAVGSRVLFDRELTDRCQVSEAGDAVVVTIDPAADPAITGEAMETVLPDHALGCAGKAVTVKWKGASDRGEGDHLVRIVSKFAPEHIEFVHGSGKPVVVWPAVLELVSGSPVTLRVRPSGRSHSEVLAAFPRECGHLAGELRDKSVVVDWPKLFVIDADTEKCLVDAMAKVSPKRVGCTVAGDDLEPFLPPPVTLADGKERCTVTVDTDAGRPAEMVRAIDRAVPRFVDRLSGKVARVVIGGSAPPSRTLLRSVLDRVAAAGPSRLELEDHGPVDVFLPPMLKMTRSGAHGVRIEADLGGRDAAQQGLALTRELDEGALPKEAVVTVVSSALDARLVEALIAHHAETVTLSDGTQLYPEVLPEPEPEVLPAPEPEVSAPKVSAPKVSAPKVSAPKVSAPNVTASKTAAAKATGSKATPKDAASSTGAAAAALVAATPGSSASPGIRVLAQNNDAMPPTVLLGVDAATDAAHIAAIEAELMTNVPRLLRRAVMIVLQDGGADIPVRASNDMISMFARVLGTGPAATLVFRGPDAQGRPHFQVLQSSVRAMPVGATFLDPRKST